MMRWLQQQWQAWREFTSMVSKFHRLSDADQMFMLEYVKLVEQWHKKHPGKNLSRGDAAELRLEARRAVGDRP